MERTKVEWSWHMLTIQNKNMSDFQAQVGIIKSYIHLKESLRERILCSGWLCVHNFKFFTALYLVKMYALFNNIYGIYIYIYIYP